MYPYNTKNTIYQNTQTHSHPATPVDSQKPDLCTKELRYDTRLLELLEMAAKNAQTMGNAYASLMQDTRLQKDAPMIRTAYLDEKKHEKYLQDIYARIARESMPLEKYIETSQETSYPIPEPAKTTEPTGTEDPLQNLEHLFWDELENVDFLGEIFSLLDDDVLRDIMSEMIRDTQDHGMRLNFLYQKYRP